MAADGADPAPDPPPVNIKVIATSLARAKVSILLSPETMAWLAGKCKQVVEIDEEASGESDDDDFVEDMNQRLPDKFVLSAAMRRLSTERRRRRFELRYSRRLATGKLIRLQRDFEFDLSDDIEVVKNKLKDLVDLLQAKADRLIGE